MDLSEHDMAGALGISVTQLRDLVSAGYVPKGIAPGEWSFRTLQAFKPLWNANSKRRAYTACKCSGAFERLTEQPGFIGRCSECRTVYLVEGLWLRTGEVVRYFNE